MKKYLLALIIATTTLMMGTAQAQHCCEDHFYIGAFGGVNFLSKVHTHVGSLSLDPGYLSGGTIGYRPSPYYRFEAELAYRKNVKTKHYNGLYYYDGTMKVRVNIETLSFMVNSYIDFADAFPGYATPYIGIGLGTAFNHGSTSAKDHYLRAWLSSWDFNFAYQGIVGINTEICHKTKVGVEYRFFKPNSKINDHSIALTLTRAL